VELLWKKFNVALGLFSKSVSRWIFAYAYFADNVVKIKKRGKNKKNVKKRKTRDLNKKRKNVYYIYGLIG